MRITFPPADCPACSTTIRSGNWLKYDAQSAEPGDFILCRNCGEILVFDTDLQPVIPVPADTANTDPEVIKQVHLVQKLIREDKARQ